MLAAGCQPGSVQHMAQLHPQPRVEGQHSTSKASHALQLGVIPPRPGRPLQPCRHVALLICPLLLLLLLLLLWVFLSWAWLHWHLRRAGD